MRVSTDEESLSGYRSTRLPCMIFTVSPGCWKLARANSAWDALPVCEPCKRRDPYKSEFWRASCMHRALQRRSGLKLQRNGTRTIVWQIQEAPPLGAEHRLRGSGEASGCGFWDETRVRAALASWASPPARTFVGCIPRLRPPGLQGPQAAATGPGLGRCRKGHRAALGSPVRVCSKQAPFLQAKDEPHAVPRTCPAKNKTFCAERPSCKTIIYSIYIQFLIAAAPPSPTSRP